MIEKHSPYLFSVRLPQCSDYKVLWASDVHFDSKNCDRELFKSHLKEADYVILGGDFLDLMQGKFDKRHQKADLRKEYGQTYFNDIIEDAVEFLMPYREKILLMNLGNHELSVVGRNEINPTSMIAYMLSKGNSHEIQVGDYSGYVVFKFYRRNNKKKVDHQHAIWYSHSSGSIGKRSKGILAADIILGENPDADMYITEHSHSQYILPVVVDHLNTNHMICAPRKKHIIQSTTYKEDYFGARRNGFQFQKNLGPRPTGGIWLDFLAKADYLKVKPSFAD